MSHCIYILHFLYLPINRHLGCLCLFANVNTVAMIISAHESLLDLFFNSFVCIPRSKVAGSYGNSVFNLLRNDQAVPFCVPTVVRF